MFYSKAMDFVPGCARDLQLRAASAKSRRSSALQHLHPQPKPVHTHEPASYHHNGIRVESRRSHVRPPASAAAATLDLDPPLTVEQLQPLHCRRIARRAPLAQGGQAHRCRAKGRERTPLRQVGGECIHGSMDGMKKLGWD
jgi:hypothetical protein